MTNSGRSLCGLSTTPVPSPPVMVGLDPTIHAARATPGLVDPRLKAEDDDRGWGDGFPHNFGCCAHVDRGGVFSKITLKLGTI